MGTARTTLSGDCSDSHRRIGASVLGRQALAMDVAKGVVKCQGGRALSDKLLSVWFIPNAISH